MWSERRAPGQSRAGPVADLVICGIPVANAMAVGLNVWSLVDVRGAPIACVPWILSGVERDANNARFEPGWGQRDMDLACLIETPGWRDTGIEALAERACAAVLEHFGIGKEVEISVLACGDARIADLNADFRGKPTPTNVLSWPALDRVAQQDGALPDLRVHDGDELGDIAIAYETCLREAEAAGRSLADHCLHLMVHGTLHLLGFDHERDGDATLMEGIEVQILGKLGVADPYSDV